jgi:hypothetical protein
VTRLSWTAAGIGALALLPSQTGDEYAHLRDGGAALDMWYRWDAGFYTSIATYGYVWQNEHRAADDMAFLPVYPIMVRAVSGLDPATGCALSPYLSTCATIGGLLVSNTALWVALLLLFDLARRCFDRQTAWRTALLLLVSPISVFLSGVYTESLFVLWTVLVFWLIERDRFALALIPAILAALTRPVGVALTPALLIVAWRTFRASPALIAQPRLRGALYALGAHLPLIVFAAYIAYMGVTVGDVTAYFSTYENRWGRDAGNAIDAFARYFRGEPVALIGWELSAFDLVMTGVCIVLALVTLRVRVWWGVFALVALAIPIASGTLVGMPRFGAVIAPFYLVIAHGMGERRWRWALVYGTSFALAVLILTRFVTWRWVA